MSIRRSTSSSGCCWVFVMPQSIFQFPTPVIVEDHGGESSFDMRLMTLSSEHLEFPLVAPNYPEPFLAPLGACIVQWGTFEEFHDGLLFAFTEANGGDLSTIRRGFEQRRKRLKSEVRNAFPTCPKIREYVSSVLGEAKIIYKDRNLLAHGHLSSRMKIHVPENEHPSAEHAKVTIIANGNENGSPVSKEFSAVDLERLFFRAAHLTGKLQELTRDDAHLPHVPSPEISELRIYRDKARLRNPNTRLCQPSPFRA